MRFAVHPDNAFKFFRDASGERALSFHYAKNIEGRPAKLLLNLGSPSVIVGVCLLCDPLDLNGLLLDGNYIRR